MINGFFGNTFNKNKFFSECYILLISMSLNSLLMFRKSIEYFELSILCVLPAKTNAYISIYESFNQFLKLFLLQMFIVYFILINFLSYVYIVSLFSN